MLHILKQNRTLHVWRANLWLLHIPLSVPIFFLSRSLMALQWGQQSVCVMWVMMRGGVLTVPFPVRDTLHVWNSGCTHTSLPPLLLHSVLQAFFHHYTSSTMSTEPIWSLSIWFFFKSLASTCHFVPLPIAKTPRLFSALKTVRLMHQQIKWILHSDTVPFVKKKLNMERHILNLCP